MSDTDFYLDFEDMLSTYSEDGHIVTAYEPSGKIKFISQSVRVSLGWEREELKDISQYAMAPKLRAQYYRRHKSKQYKLFKTIFWARSKGGGVFTVEEEQPQSILCEAICVLDKEMSIVSWNSRCVSLSGLEKLDVVGESFSALMPAMDAASVTQTVGNVLKSGNHILNCHKVKLLRPGKEDAPRVGLDLYSGMDGRVVCRLHSASGVMLSSCSSCRTDPISLDGGDSTDTPGANDNDFSSSAVDWTRLVALEEENAFTRDFMSNAIVPMYSVNPSGVVIWANRAMLDLMGYTDSTEEYLGVPCHPHFNDTDELNNCFTIINSGRNLEDHSMVLVRRDGAKVLASYNSSALFDESGKFVHSRCVVYDNTLKVRLQQERDSLEQQRVEALFREKQAVAASEVKTSFLATMSHEIRTPINGVIGMASLLANTDMGQEQRDYVDTIAASADLLLSLVNNILDITKIETGRMDLDWVPFNLQRMLETSWRIVQGRANEKNVRFTTYFQEVEGGAEADANVGDWYMGDPKRITQVLLNLLSNAIKFTSEGGSVECRVTLNPQWGQRSIDAAAATRTQPAGEKSDVPRVSDKTGPAGARGLGPVVLVGVEVVDTGIGIEADVVEKLFSPFVQASQHTFNNYGGTGLGLNISRQIMDLMGGAVLLESTPGEGTTARVVFPLERRAATDVPESSKGGLRVGRSTANVRIMVVDDMAVNQKVIRRMLETLEYTQVTVRSNGREALDEFNSARALGKPYDTIFMDCIMPEMTGWEATEEIRRLERETPDVKSAVVFALTANATTEDKERCLAIGMDLFLMKPITREAVGLVMEEWEQKMVGSS